MTSTLPLRATHASAVAHLVLVRPTAVLRILLLVCLASTACAVAAPTAALHDRDTQLVGTFLASDFDFSQSLTIRRPDHTFTEYRFQVLDYAKPPAIALELYGTWALKGQKYCDTIIRCSYAPWRTLVSRTRCQPIVSVSSDAFTHVSQDGAPIRERRLSASDAARFSRDPFGFVSPATRQKYGFERH